MCALVLYESTHATPSRTDRCSGHRGMTPPHAPSTWSHAPWLAQIGPMDASGSYAPVEVVPRVAQTKNGHNPCPRAHGLRGTSRLACGITRKFTLCTIAAFHPFPYTYPPPTHTNHELSPLSQPEWAFKLTRLRYILAQCSMQRAVYRSMQRVVYLRGTDTCIPRRHRGSSASPNRQHPLQTDWPAAW